MTPQERLGKRWFLIVATLMVPEKLAGAWQGRFGHGAVVHSLISLSLVLSLPFLWRGYTWLSRLVAVVCVLSGGLALFAFGRELADFDVPGSSLSVGAGVLGLLDVLAGLAFLFLPSLQAFFRYQREGPRTDLARDDRLSPALANQPRSFSQLVAASGWGLALGCGGVVLVILARIQSFDFDFRWGETVAPILGGVAAGGVTGLVAGLAAGPHSPGASQTNLRVAGKRGLIAAGACVITLAVVSAIWGGLFGFHPAATIYGTAPPGWEGAATMALFCVIFAGPPVALVGFVLGGAVALLIRDS
jgi:hypothetical protein